MPFGHGNFVYTPTNLNNRKIQTGDTEQYIGIVDMICEGPIRGLVDGKRSVFLDNVPFEEAKNISAPANITSGTSTVATLAISQGGTTGVGNGYTFTSNDVGKFLIVQIANQQFTGSQITQLSISGYLMLTLNSGVSNILTGTYNNNLLYAKLSNTTSIETDTLALEGELGINTTSHVHTFTSQVSPTSITIDTSKTHVLRLYAAYKIVSVNTGTNSITIDTSSNSYSSTWPQNTGSWDFLLQSAAPVEASIRGPGAASHNNIKKVEASTLQFRRGTHAQVPFSDMNGVVGGISTAGTGGATPLKQPATLPAEVTALGFSYGSWNNGNGTYDNYGYPPGQSFADNSGDVVVIPANSGGTGIGFGLTSGQISQVDEVNIRITYPSLYTINTENADKESAHAHYVFQVQTELGAESSDWKTLFSQHGGVVIHSGKTTAPTSFDHTIGLGRFKPFDDFKIRIVRLTRPSGMPVSANGSAGGRTNRDKWQLQAVSSISGASLSATIKDKLSYPYTAASAITFSSKNFSNLPQRSYLLEGMKVRIPSSYTPREYTTNGVAQYSGFWNGTFKDELYYTDNPAWIFYDIITNKRYGAGKWISAIDINEYALYRIAQYCDELVDDGNGGTEPRFRANLYLSKATEIFKVLKDMASMFTGMLYWMDGKLNVVQDLPSEPVYTFAKSNVINGVFNYEGTSRKNRTNQAVVTWNDPTANYEPVNLIVEDREAIAREGKIITESAVAMGSTSEGQAIRYGRWKVWTAQNQKEIISFDTGLQGSYIRPGDVINVQDSNKFGIELSGRVSSSSAPTSNSITLDRPIDILSGTYTLSTLVESYAAFYTGLDTINVNNVTYAKGARITGQLYINGSLATIDSEEKASSAQTSGGSPVPLTWKPYTYIQENTLSTSAGTGVTTLTTSSNFGVTPKTGSVWALTRVVGGAEVLGSLKEYKVLAVSHSDDGNIFSITAVEYYLEKYDSVDKDYALGVVDGGVYSDSEDSEGVVPAPANIFIVLETDAKQPGEELRIEWEKPQEEYTASNNSTQERDYEFFAGYELVHNIPNVSSPMFTEQTSIRFDNVPNGFYTFRVRTISKGGNSSDFISTQYDVEDPYNQNVPRMQEGIVKGGVSNAQISINSDSELAFQTNPCAFASLADPLNSRSITNVYDLTSLTTTDSYYAYVGTSLKIIYWDTLSLNNLPFWREIPASANRFSSQASQWTSLGTLAIAKNSNTVTGTGFTNNILPRDIISLGEEVFSYGSISSISVSGGTTTITTSTSHGLLDGDRVKLATTVSGGAHELNQSYFYIDRITNTTFVLYNDFDKATSVFSNKYNGSSLSSYSDEGSFQQIHTAAAIVTSVISNTELRIDRAFDFAISTTGYRSDFRPDYEQHAIVAEVVKGGTSPDFTYATNTFLVIDPNLNLGKSITVAPNISSLRYDGEGVQETSYSSITATATAIGFISPKFKFYSKSSGLSGTLDTSFQDPDSTGGQSYTFTINNSSNIPFNNGIAEEIVVRAIESFDTGDVFEGKGIIAKSSTGADGVAGHTVTLQAEDYTVIYNDLGTTPVYNGSSTNSTLDFTATPSTSLSSPQYRFTFTPGTYVTSNDFTKVGFGAWQSSNVATVSVPSLASSWDSSGSDNPGSYQVKVEVREGNVNTVLAFDIITVQGIKASEDGYWISFSNEAHNIPSTFEGVPEGVAGTTAHVIGAASGTTLEVGKGGTILQYVTSTPGEGEWAITSTTESPTNVLNLVGTPSWNSGTGLLTVADHEFSTGWSTEVASLVYAINVENQATIYRTQTFTKSKIGFAGIQITNSNPSQSLAADSNGKVVSFAGSGTEINVQAFGTSIPYYATAPSGVTTYWNYDSSYGSDVTNGRISTPSITPPTNGSLGAAVVANFTAFSSSSQRVTIEYNINVYVKGVLEEYVTKQIITKNTNASAISLIPSHTHVTFNSAGSSPTPGNYTFSWANPTIPAGVTPYYILNDGNSNLVSSATVTSTVGYVSIPSVNSNLPRTYTVTMYDGNPSSGGVALASDKVTVGKSLDGAEGQDGIVANITAERASVSYNKNAQQTYDADDNSVQLTVDTFGITNPQYSWTGQATSTSVNSAQNSIPFSNGVSQTVAKQAKTASVEVTGQDSAGQAITAIQKSITIGTSVGAVGSDGDAALRISSGFIYYQQSSSGSPTSGSQVSTSGTDFTFSSGQFTGLQQGWLTTAPTFQAANANVYWYAYYTVKEARDSDGLPANSTQYDSATGDYQAGDVTFSAPLEGMGFTGLVTFTSQNSISNGQQQSLSFGTGGTTTIDGGSIITNTIQANKINLSSMNSQQTTAILQQTGAQTQAFDQSSDVDVTQTQNYNQVITVQQYSTQITPGNIGVYDTTQVYQKSQTYDVAQAQATFETSLDVQQAISQATSSFVDAGDVTSQIQQQSPVQSVNGQTGAVSGLLNFTTSGTQVQAGKILLTSGNVVFTTSTQTTVYQPSNSIVLDTTSGSNSIRIYDGTTERVRLGKL